MELVPELRTKHQSLLRRVASLPAELDSWIRWSAAGKSLEKNFSQVKALDHFMRTLYGLIEVNAKELGSVSDVDAFLSRSFDLAASVIKSQIVWDFFRSRLELRFMPHFHRSLLVADLVSYDCYVTIIDRARALQIVPSSGFREYPLTGLMARFSPVTWPRGGRPPALQNGCLPVPVIDLPWQQLVNPWELLAIAHEVGHDVDEDLGQVTLGLRPVITNRLMEVKAPAQRLIKWQEWISEILADLVGILLTGPAYGAMLAELLTLPRNQVRYLDPSDDHPPHYLRMFINAAVVRRLGLTHYATYLEDGWKTLYGEPSDEFGPYLGDIEPIVSSVLDSSIDALRDRHGRRHSLSELIVFTSEDQTRIEDAAADLSAGVPPGKPLPIRHVVSASQVAFRQMANTGGAVRSEELAHRTQETIIALAPAPQLSAGLASGRARKRLDDLVHTLIERPLDDFDIHLSSATEDT